MRYRHDDQLGNIDTLELRVGRATVTRKTADGKSTARSFPTAEEDLDHVWGEMADAVEEAERLRGKLDCAQHLSRPHGAEDSYSFEIDRKPFDPKLCDGFAIFRVKKVIEYLSAVYHEVSWTGHETARPCSFANATRPATPAPRNLVLRRKEYDYETHEVRVMEIRGDGRAIHMKQDSEGEVLDQRSIEISQADLDRLWGAFVHEAELSVPIWGTPRCGPPPTPDGIEDIVMDSSPPSYSVDVAGKPVRFTVCTSVAGESWKLRMYLMSVYDVLDR